MFAICLYRINKRAGIWMLPSGPWSLHVTPAEIDVESNGVVTHLTPDQVEEVDLRILHGRRGRKTLFSCVQLRLRPGVAAPYLTRDGWFPVYLNPTSELSPIPTELVAALYRFAGRRTGLRFANMAAYKHIW
jgi:hypothetical protein